MTFSSHPQNIDIWTRSDKWLSRSLQCLREGLYLGLFNCLVTVKGPSNPSSNNVYIYIYNTLKVVLVQKDYPSLPPLKKIREKSRLDQLESDILEKAVIDDKMILKSDFTKNLVDCFAYFNSATTTPLSLKQLISITPTQLENDVQLLVLAQVTPLGMKLPAYDTDQFELIPLQLFEMIHFNRYDSKVFINHFRKMRILKSNKQENKSAPSGTITTLKTTTATTKISSSASTAMNSIIANEMKEASKKYNDGKWTRISIALSSMKTEVESTKNVSKDVEESAEVRRMREIAPF